MNAPAVATADVELVGVTKRFGALVAVDRLDLEIRQGEFLSLLGPSGCGKTTTLRLVAGFERPDEGAIRIDGADVARLPPYRRPVNTVFQSYALVPHHSVLDHVSYGLKQQGLPRMERRRRAGELLELVRLPGVESRKPRQLSGGQQQRVALARALVLEPKVLLLDEPLGALDLKVRKELQIELKRIQQDVGITFVYVTHDQEEALAMSDRVAVMNRGRIEQLARPQEIYDAPATPLRPGEPLLLQPVGDVVQHGEVREERVRLEDGVDRTAVGRQPGDVGAVDPDRALVRALEAGDQPQRRRLPAAGRPEEREELTLADLEVEPVDGDERAEALGHADELDVGRCEG